MLTKGAQFLYLASQGGVSPPCPPANYTTGSPAPPVYVPAMKSSKSSFSARTLSNLSATLQLKSFTAQSSWNF